MSIYLKCLVIPFVIFHTTCFSQLFDFSKKSDYEKVKNRFDTLGLQNYILEHPKAKKYTPIITDRLNCLRKKYAFDKISNSNDSVDFQKFILKFESISLNCSEIEGITNTLDKARLKLDEIRILSKWAILKSRCNTLILKSDQELLTANINSINQFLSDFPYANESILQEANDLKQLINDELKWKKSLQTYTLESFKNYSNDNSNTTKAYQILCAEKIRELEAWEAILKKNNHTEIVSFKKEFSNSKFVLNNEIDEKLKAIEQTDWEKAKKINTVTSYDKFMAKFEEGYYYNQAADKIHYLLSHLPNNMAQIIYSYSEENDFEFLRDPNESSISIKNSTDKIVKVQFTGSSSKAIIIQPGSTKELNLLNGLYSIIVSCPFDVKVNPLKGQQEFRGYMDYVGDFILRSSFKNNK